MGNKERQAEMDTRQEKEEALWRQLEQTDTAKETQLKHNEKKKGNHVTAQVTFCTGSVHTVTIS